MKTETETSAKTVQPAGQDEHRGIMFEIKADELPLEPVDTFSDAPFEFEEAAQILWEGTRKLYYSSRIANRFSDHYLNCCAQLEKNIRQLGSFCITKTVLEQKGEQLPALSGLNIEELVRMASFHLRKTNAAFEGIYRDNNSLGLTYLDWEYRWVNLGNRLKATEVKIQKIKDGKINADDLLERAETFKNKPRSSATPHEDILRDLETNPKALPIKGSMARLLTRIEKSEEHLEALERRIRQKKEREIARLEREAERCSPIKPYPIRKEDRAIVANIRKEQLQKTLEEEDRKKEPPEGMIRAAEARRILMEDAMKRGDQAAALAIPMEDHETFLARWMEYLKKDEIKSRGPSDAKRKELREKRKKKKR